MPTAVAGHRLHHALLLILLRALSILLLQGEKTSSVFGFAFPCFHSFPPLTFPWATGRAFPPPTFHDVLFKTITRRRKKERRSVNLSDTTLLAAKGFFSSASLSPPSDGEDEDSTSAAKTMLTGRGYGERGPFSGRFGARPFGSGVTWRFSSSSRATWSTTATRRIGRLELLALPKTEQAEDRDQGQERKKKPFRTLAAKFTNTTRSRQIALAAVAAGLIWIARCRIVPSPPWLGFFRLSSSTTSSSWIAADDVAGNAAILFVVAAAAPWLGIHTRLGRWLGPPVTAMALTLLLATVGILAPGGSAAATRVQSLALHMATPLVLLGADFSIQQQSTSNANASTSSPRSWFLLGGGPMLLSFAFASTATAVAAVLGWLAAGTGLGQALGPSTPLVTSAVTAAGSRPLHHDALGVAAALLAKNIGGGINYLAVCQALQISSAAAAAGWCVDNLMALIYFPVTSVLSARYPPPPPPPPVLDPSSSSGSEALNRENQTEGTATAWKNDNIGSSSTRDTADLLAVIATDTMVSNDRSQDVTLAATDQFVVKSDRKAEMISVQSILHTLALSTTLLWWGRRLGGGAATTLPICTLLTVLVAVLAPRSAPWVQAIRHTAEPLGTVALYLFFASAGAPGALLADAVRSSLRPLALFLSILYAVHGLILTGLHLGLRQPPRGSSAAPLPESIWQAAVRPPRLLVASSAAIGGPATAVALAKAAGWTSLEVPGILVGNIGYAVATFCGLAYYYFALSWL